VQTNRSGQDPSGLSPLEGGEFGRLLARLTRAGPVAVAVSGGADSLALCLLAAAWARREGRPLTALTVDHGLRPNSAAEAAQVRDWLAARGIAHVILNWTGPKPVAGLQAVARRARYDLLLTWCRGAGVRDLLVAHHRDDQAETVLLRAARGTGTAGRAGMAAATERDGVRLLRPLLAVPRARLRATLIAQSQPWIEDPSNHDPRFARVRARQALALVPTATAALANQADVHAALRIEREADVRDFLQAYATFSQAGYGYLAAGARTAPLATVARALAWMLRTIAGREYGPRTAALDQLARWIRGDARGARTLHGCVVAAQGGGFLVCREARALPVISVTAGISAAWDNRFRVTLQGGSPDTRHSVQALGVRGWQAARERAAHLLPYRAAQSVPALYAGGTVVAVPHLGIESPGVALSVLPLSAETLALTPFAVVSGPG
jgi:tRNA(Ile)-lysidine synthase